MSYFLDIYPMKMKISITLYFILLISTVFASAEKKDRPLTSYHPNIWKSPIEGSLKFRHAAPVRMKKGAKYPLLVFFHGAGGRGADNKGQLIDAGGLSAFEKVGLRTKLNSHIFAGQVPKGEKWVNVSWSLLGHKTPEISNSMRMTMEAMDSYVQNPKNQVDTNRIYAMGLSMGGYGTWDAILRRPDFFAAAVPICGGGDKSIAKKLAHLPIWAWHGEKDNVIKPSRSRDMIDAIKKAGGTPKYSEIKGRGHNSWLDCWKSEEMWAWLYSQRKK
jgi:predicted peptidase